MRTLLFFLVVLPLLSFSQEKYPTDDFVHPVDFPLVISGTFGELRPNHFHSGIDIKTKGVEGLEVNSIGLGHVSRIKISLWGFGKALYIDHPNGFTSVYAHLKKFSPKIEAYIKKRQYEKRTHQIEIFPKNLDLPIKQGELIAFSGNTGGSAGAHLHFEIREKKGQIPLNPLLFGLNVADNKPPTVQAMYAYSLKDSAQVNGSERPVKLKLTRQEDGSFIAQKIRASGTIGFGLVAYDRLDLAYNKNGAYKVTMDVNGRPHFTYDFESFSFSESRYINALIDYGHYKRNKQRVQRLFRIPANELSIYKDTRTDGTLSLEEGMTYQVKVEVRDFMGNTTKVIVPVEGRKMEVLKREEITQTDYFLVAGRDNIYEIGPTSIYFPGGAFYENLYLDLEYNRDKLKIHNGEVPVHKNFTITFDVNQYTVKERERMYIARYNGKGRSSYHSTKKKGNVFTARSKTLGTYFLAKDTIPPTIEPVNFRDGKWLSKFKYLKLTIQDKGSGIKSYVGTIDGDWALFEYEPKTRTLTYNFNDLELRGAKHNLRVVVTDNVGNSTTFSSVFFRKKLDGP